MSVEHVEIIVEEPSMAEALKILVPRIAPKLSFQVHQHQGKHDLLAKLPDRLRGYRRWIPSDWRIVVIVDRDDDDCGELKEKLERIANNANVVSRTGAAENVPWVVVNRIAIEELEAWYFGDWNAVRGAYPRVAAAVASRKPYRRSDEIAGGTWEAFERELQHAGYFSGGFRKIEAARAVASHMDPARNRSPSFRAVRDILIGMATHVTS